MKKLYLSPDKKFLGVCGGVADYFGVDPTLIRILTAFVAVWTAIVPCLIVYVVLSFVFPQPETDYYQTNANTSKKLYKSQKDKKVSGVCAGYGEYFGIDPTIVRLVFALGLFFVGFSLPLYIISVVLMPSDIQVINNI